MLSVLKNRWLWVFVAFAALAAATGAFAYNWARNYALTQFTNLAEFTAPSITAPPSAVNTSPEGRPLVYIPQPWTGKERVNVLLMGIDQRQGEKDPGYRTDTMIVLTLDPVTLSAGMLSVPRDLWVPIPGYGNGRINTANQNGDAYGYPGGGPELARKTVQGVLGVPVHYFVRLNFTAFEDLIDRIGGITVEVPKDINDPAYPTEDYGTEVFSIKAGVHKLDGATALKYARTRHGSSDFDRARRQQQVILAVRDRMKDPQVLAYLAGQAPEVLAKLNQSVKTDMTIDQMMQLGALAQKVDLRNIKSAVLDENYTELALTQTDPPQAVQVPIRSRIAQLRETFFSTPVNAAVERLDDPAVAATAVAPDWRKEGARVAVLNGTLSAGLAQKVADLLASKGFTVARVGNAPNNKFDYDRTQITDYNGKSLTVTALSDAMKVPGAEVRRLLDPTAKEDIVIVIGSDFKLP